MKQKQLLDLSLFSIINTHCPIYNNEYISCNFEYQKEGDRYISHLKKSKTITYPGNIFIVFLYS